MNKSLNNTRGLTYDEYFAQKRGAVRAKGTSGDSQRGVPMGSYVVADECQGITKAGLNCKARPVKGRFLCAGHLKQIEAMHE